MLYAVISQDAAGTLDKRLAARPQHLKRLEQLRDEGRLVMPTGWCPIRTTRSSSSRNRRVVASCGPT